MQNIVLFLLLCAAVLTSACGGRRRDAAYYERMVDSIRRAETVKAMMRNVPAADNDPAAAFLDTLPRRALPLQYSPREVQHLPGFADLPSACNVRLGYQPDAHLKAVALPRVHDHRMFLVAELTEAAPPVLRLCLMDADHQPTDMLCIYEETVTPEADGLGRTYMEYFVTHQYEITLMRYFVRERSMQAELREVRRYVVAKDGTFEETVVEL